MLLVYKCIMNFFENRNNKSLKQNLTLTNENKLELTV